MNQPITTVHRISCGYVNKCIRIAVVADVHNSQISIARAIDSGQTIDYIVVVGDLLYAVEKNHTIYDHLPDSGQHLRNAENAISFLKEAVEIAPVFFSSGNHELYLDDEDRALLSGIGVCYLDDEYRRSGDLVFGGLSSPYKIFAGTGVSHTKEEHKRRWKKVFENVNTSWLDEFEMQEGYKILLCHHPEFYEPFLKGREGIDLILSGHAHGGQIRLFGRGLYAYGQGLFPKYTSGIYDNKLIVSRGLSNTSWIPRLWNPTEIIYVDLLPHFHNYPGAAIRRKSNDLI